MQWYYIYGKRRRVALGLTTGLSLNRSGPLLSRRFSIIMSLFLSFIFFSYKRSVQTMSSACKKAPWSLMLAKTTRVRSFNVSNDLANCLGSQISPRRLLKRRKLCQLAKKFPTHKFYRFCAKYFTYEKSCDCMEIKNYFLVTKFWTNFIVLNPFLIFSVVTRRIKLFKFTYFRIFLIYTNKLCTFSVIGVTFKGKHN